MIDDTTNRAVSILHTASLYLSYLLLKMSLKMGTDSRMQFETLTYNWIQKFLSAEISFQTENTYTQYFIDRLHFRDTK